MSIQMRKMIFALAGCWLALFLGGAAIGAEQLQHVRQNEPGVLDIQVFATDDLGFMQEWKTTPPDRGPTIHRIRMAKFNEMFHVGFIVTGCVRNPEGYVSFTMDLKVTSPDGQLAADEKAWAVHNARLDAEQGLILVDQTLDVVVESGDPAGKYLFEATVNDQVSGKSAIGMYEVVVSE